MISASRPRDDTAPVLTVGNRRESVGLVLTVADDPGAGAAQMARAVGTDPALATRVVALANSSYYGVRGHVGGLDVAVSVLGFTTIRAVALMSAAAEGPVPGGFWRQTALAATGSALLAPVFDVRAPDAFCLGLLHTLGSALLHQRSALPALCLPEPAAVEELLACEQTRYGTDHATAGASALAEWGFPARFCRVVAHHHDVPLPDGDALGKVLFVARTCVDHVLGDADLESVAPEVERVSAGRIDGAELALLTRSVADRAGALADALHRFGG